MRATLMFVLASFACCVAAPATTAADAAPAPVTAQVQEKGATLGNGIVSVVFDLPRGTFSLQEVATGDTLLADAGVGETWDEEHWLTVLRHEEVQDELGKGRRIILELHGRNYQEPKHEAHSKDIPTRLHSFTLYEGRGCLVMGFGLANPKWHRGRLMEAFPLARGRLFPGREIASPQTLNGAAGAEPAIVKPGLSRLAPNSLMLTGMVAGRRRTVVAGGLANADFGKYAALRDGVLELEASDPVGRLVETEETYLAPDTFYLDMTIADPFLALETYGRALRLVTHARPNVYDFPLLCGWGVGALSKLPGVNNSRRLIDELDAANACGLTRYTKVGLRLEPDKYHGDTEQGWWDDAHWAKYGHLVPPYDTMAKWCAAVTAKNGIPYTYFQVGMPSDDYAQAFPGHMLFDDISQLAKKHMHHQPFVTYDYTDPDFQKHMREVWARLRADGMRGVKFDYPETGWRPEGGFADRFATTTSAYRKVFQLAREGLGPDAFLDERNLGESGRPCLDVTAGIVDTQRNWSDSNGYVPAMVTIGGLRWFKNRTVFNYYPDSKVVHDCAPAIRRSMLTMIALTSGRLDLATSFTLFTPDIVRDVSRIYPTYREPFTARPLDAFTGVRDPQVYDLELAPDWHQVALYNTGAEQAVVGTALAGDRVANAVGLDPQAEYHAYEFWSDAYVGKLPGTGRLERSLEPNACAMVSLRKVQPHPQVVSTNRHILQGWMELADVAWDPATGRLSGTAHVIGGEPLKIVLADNGFRATQTGAEGGQAGPAAGAADGLVTVTLERPTTGDVRWHVDFVRR